MAGLMTGWVWIVCLVPALCAAGRDSWTWQDKEGHRRTRADLDAILNQHEIRVNTAHQSGAQANLSGASLVGANLSGADLMDADLKHANFEVANFSTSKLLGADLSGADLESSNLLGAILFNANLSGADLSAANLTGADLTRANLSGADLKLTDLAVAVYEPTEQPSAEYFSLATGLGLLRYRSNSGPIYALRKSFGQAGFRTAESKLQQRFTATVKTSWNASFNWTCEWDRIGYAPWSSSVYCASYARSSIGAAYIAAGEVLCIWRQRASASLPAKAKSGFFEFGFGPFAKVYRANNWSYIWNREITKQRQCPLPRNSSSENSEPWEPYSCLAS